MGGWRDGGMEGWRDDRETEPLFSCVDVERCGCGWRSGGGGGGNCRGGSSHVYVD